MKFGMVEKLGGKKKRHINCGRRINRINEKREKRMLQKSPSWLKAGCSSFNGACLVFRLTVLLRVRRHVRPDSRTCVKAAGLPSGRMSLTPDLR